MISAAVALGISLGAAVAAVPSAHAQTVKISPSTVSASGAKPVVGVNLYVDQNYPLAAVKAWGWRDLKYIAYTLKLKAVAIDWDYNVPSAGSDVVRSSPTRTPRIADLMALTKIAKYLGLRVEYRALFAIDNVDDRSSSIAPKNLGRWLNSLLSTETPALKLAEREAVPEFVVGTEMASIDQSPLWADFFSRAAKVYVGALSYASWGGQSGTSGFFGSHRVVLPVYHLGASAYPPIALPDNASVASLTTAWKNFLTAHTPASVLSRTTIDELGIPALAGSYSDPWQWHNLTGTADPTIQAHWFTAACDAVAAEHMRGIYFWSMNLNDDPAHPFSSLVSFEGRPASVAAIRSCA